MLTYNQSQASFSPRQFSSTRMEQYFLPKTVPVMAHVLWSAGGIVALFCIVLQIFLFLPVGLSLLFLGISWIVVTKRSNPTDQQYDQWIETQANALLLDTLATLDLYEHQLTGKIKRIRSFVLPGSEIADNYRSNEVLVKRGRDGRWRCSINVCTYFIPTAYGVAMVTRDVNVFQQSSYIWQNEEYSYPHIVSAAMCTIQDTAYIERERYWYRIKQICVNISNGEVIPFGAYFSATPIDDDPYAPDFSLPDIVMNQTINDLRRTLRTRNPRNPRGN